MLVWFISYVFNVRVYSVDNDLKGRQMSLSSTNFWHHLLIILFIVWSTSIELIVK